MLRAGVKDFLTSPFESGAVQEMLGRVEALLNVKPEIAVKTAPTFAFRPAKGSTNLTSSPS